MSEDESVATPSAEQDPANADPGSQRARPRSTMHDRFAGWLAFALLAVFLVGLVFTGGLVIWYSGETIRLMAVSQAEAVTDPIIAESVPVGALNFWSDLFKTGLMLVGASVTTIVGYYFGSRGTADAQQQAFEAQEQAATALSTMRIAETRVEEAQSAVAALREEEARLKESNEVYARAAALADPILEGAEGIIPVDLED